MSDSYCCEIQIHRNSITKFIKLSCIEYNLEEFGELDHDSFGPNFLIQLFSKSLSPKVTKSKTVNLKVQIKKFC